MSSQDFVREVYDASYRHLVVQMLALSGDQAEAEDVVQEAFVKAIGQAGRFGQLDNPEAWLRTVAMNSLRNRWRRTSVLRRVAPRIPGVQQRAELSPDHVDLVSALRKLPVELREVVVLHHLADLPVGKWLGHSVCPRARSRRALSAVETCLRPLYQSARSPTMSDFESFRRDAGNQVVPPAFDDLVATSRRRRRTAAASAIVAVAAVVSVVTFGLQGVYGDQTAPVQPVGPTTVAPDCAALWDQVRLDVVASGLPDGEARRQADLARLRCERRSTPGKTPATTGRAAPACASARPADPAVAPAAEATVSVFFTCAATVAKVPTPVYAVDRAVPADMTERDRVAFVVGEYLRGPSPEEAEDGYRGNLTGIIAAALDDVSLQDGVVTVNFLPSADEALGSLTSTESMALQSALSAGVFQFPSVQELRVTLAGNCDEFWRHLEMTCQTLRAPSPTPVPSPTKDTSPSPDEPPDRLTPTQVVNDERSTISHVAVSPGDPETKAVIWQYCGGERGCDSQQFALTVTADGFKTSHDIALPGPVWPDMQAIDTDTFYVAVRPNGWLVDSNGSVSQVQVRQAARPLAPGEVFVVGPPPIGATNANLALDPETATAHFIPTPERAGLNSLKQNADGTLVGTAYDYSGRYTRAVM